MGPMLITWLVAEGIIIYRTAAQHIPPRPGQLLATSGAFVALAVLAEFAPELATAIGAGVDIAALFQAWPGSSSTGGSGFAASTTTSTPAGVPLAA